MDSAKPLPISRTTERLLAQVQAEAQAATLEALSAKDGIVVLHPIDAQPHIRCRGDDMYVGDSRGGTLWFYRRRELPESWIGHSIAHAWHPSHWAGALTLIDGQGREWVHRLGAHVTNDFGDLVSVEGGAA